jgi:hypothetical protein
MGWQGGADARGMWHLHHIGLKNDEDSGPISLLRLG